eukprot:TRINITY_DN72_c0_g1_i2.p1 TRINITY_DN72_c0_g1~~TRINITY_DN72_c0_g1_i2.p1  ORF type:complete len:633 (-),score=134.95 TRINITY_DN72_c0_g1_i2:446-2344(-)
MCIRDRYQRRVRGTTHRDNMNQDEVTRHIQTRLMSFMRTNGPNQLREDSNLQSESTAPTSPRKSWNRVSDSIALTRQQSVEALQSLADIGEVERQRSIERLPSIERVRQSNPRHQLNRLSDMMQSRAVVRKRIRALRAFRLQRRLANATGSPQLPASHLVDKELEHQIEQQKKETKPEEHNKSPSSGNALRRMVGHDLPYGWQISHEIMVNDQFEFSPDGLVLEDPVHRRFVRLFLRAADDKQQHSLAAAFTEISTSSSATPELVEVVERSLHQVADVLSGITDSAQEGGFLDASYICQMISQQAYGPEQLLNLITHVCNQAADASILEAPCVIQWLQDAGERIEHAVECCQLLSFAAILIHELLSQLKKLRTDEMNARLAIFRPAFKNIGAEFERCQVMKAVKTGELELERTAAWLDEAWNAVGASQLSGAAMVNTHRLAMQTLIQRMALENKRSIKAAKLPEILVLDVNRLNEFRAEVRSLSVGVALFTLATGILKSIGVTLVEDRQKWLQLEILEELSTARNSDALSQAVAIMIQVAASDKLQNLPSQDKLINALKNASTSREARGLRALFTKRITAAIVCLDITPEHVHSSLRSIQEQVLSLGSSVDKLLKHLEQAYAQLYIALLGSM